MKNRFLTATVAAAALLCCSPILLAAPAAYLHVPVQAKFGKTKMISFHMRNDSSAPVKFKAGDKEMTLAPGKTVDLKLAEGVSIVAEEATPTVAAGAVLTIVSSPIQGATVVVH